MFLEVKDLTSVGFTSECDANQHKKSNQYFHVYGHIIWTQVRDLCPNNFTHFE